MFSLLHLSPNSSRLLISIAVTALTCLALTLLDAWPSTTKRKLWETFVHITPSQLIYAMEFPSRRRQWRGQSNVSFRRKDFGNHQAKSEALERVFGFDDTLGAAVQHARRLSGLDKVLGSSAITPAGLGNWDNSCYQNSVIQSLASLFSFDDYLAKNVERMSEDGTKSTHEALRNIFGRLNHLDNEGKRLWIPSVLKSMNSWQQQDAQEYFSRVIDEVEKEHSRAAKDRATELGFRCAGDVESQSGSWQCNPFQGLLAQRVGCTRCGYTEGLSLLPFTCLTVNLGMQSEYNVRDCLDEYTALESIEGVECIKCTVLRTKASLEHVLFNMDNRDASKPSVEPDTASISTLRITVTERLQVINEVCEAGDFSDICLYKKCNISVKNRVSSTKSKQAVIARASKDLVIHVNRSIFDATGVQRKNHARVRFPPDLNLNRWCLGSDCANAGQDLLEVWNTSPTSSMLPKAGTEHLEAGRVYKLRAVITHYGGHENGHYIAYRKRSSNVKGLKKSSEDAKRPGESWFRFSDDNVSAVSEEHVLSQGGVFMLFYEAIVSTRSTSLATPQPVVEESTVTSWLVNPVVPHEENDDRMPTQEGFEADHAVLDPARSANRVLPSVDVDAPVKSSPPAVSSSSLEDLKSRPDTVVQSEPARLSTVAPIMRTAGALSPNSRQGRQTSNISIHSPSFITAS